MTPSRIEIIVDFADCDPARIVFYPSYFEWFDRATERMFRSRGMPWAQMFPQYRMAGVALVDARRPVVGDRAVPSLRQLRSGARRFAGRLTKASALASVVPIVCLTQAIAGPPVDAAGVRFVKLADLSRDISARPGMQSHTRAQSAARALGVHVAGDQRRHFTVRS